MTYSLILAAISARRPIPVAQFLEQVEKEPTLEPALVERAKRDLDKLAKLGAHVTHPGLPDYPDWLSDLPDPPVYLSYLGSPCWKSNVCLSAVGSREASRDALGWVAKELGEVARAGTVLVSGGARGIDQAVHGAAVRAGKPTVAFLPSGLQNIYPSGFDEWIPPIIERGGAIVSELAFDAPMMKHYFHQRNRMIAAISPILVVAQAGRRSGSIMTARIAGELNRVLTVVPGFPGDPWWAGSVDLIVSGAQPIRDATDLGLLLAPHRALRIEN